VIFERGSEFAIPGNKILKFVKNAQIELTVMGLYKNRVKNHRNNFEITKQGNPERENLK
jgi:hypothetical protein